MLLKIKSLRNSFSTLAVSLLGFAALGAAPAHAVADNYSFAYSALGVTGQQELIINGSTIINATSAGWVDNSGDNINGSGNYLVGACCGGSGDIYNNYFSFSLNTLTGPINTAVLSVYQPSVAIDLNDGFYGAPATFVAHNATGLNLTTPDNVTGIALYNAISSANVLGTTGVSTATDGTQVNVTFNTAALNAIKSAEGGIFQVGGTLRIAGVSAVPLPAGLPMFVLAMLGMFTAVQFGKRKFA